MNLMELRLDLLFTDFSQYFGIILMVFAIKFFVHGHESKMRLKVK